MKPTKETLSIWFDEINKKHFSSQITKIPILWNSRLRTCAGQCVFKVIDGNCLPIKITLSNKLFENNNWDVSKIKRTLLHEMVHAYLLEYYNERGHTNRFQMIMTRITGENKNHRCHDYDVKGLRNKRNVAYWCPCGLTEGNRSRMPKAGVIYKAKCCNGIVKFKRMGFFD